MPFRPMRAPDNDPQKDPNFFNKLQYPLSCSPKLDGIRGVVRNNVVTSRSGEPLPSYQVQEELSKAQFTDGEIIEGNPTDFGVYNRTQSHVMSHNKPGDIKYYIFDYVNDNALRLPYYQRLELAKQEVIRLNDPQFVFVEHEEVDNYDELIAYEEKRLKEGWEGIMMYNPVEMYKQGKATFLQNISYKLKRFSDTEGIIVGFEEQMTNTNEQTRSELGYAKRSTAKAGMVPAGTLGKFLVMWNGVELTVGCGVFTHKERQEIWNNRELYMYRILKFRYFGHGVKDLPRFPRALGVRSVIDL